MHIGVGDDKRVVLERTDVDAAERRMPLRDRWTARYAGSPASIRACGLKTHGVGRTAVGIDWFELRIDVGDIASQNAANRVRHFESDCAQLIERAVGIQGSVRFIQGKQTILEAEDAAVHSYTAAHAGAIDTRRRAAG